jgi:hypothetical protein
MSAAAIRPPLNPVSVILALRAILRQDPPGSVVITMSEGQWDEFLEAGYEGGHILLELDEGEWPARAYQKGGTR